MSEEGDLWRDYKRHKREQRDKFGVNCPRCQIHRPLAHPSILMPGQKCRVDGYVDPRERKGEKP